jgi:2-desacetyl-2-hydroxyethyl bacteriochlorophyllide A dehydrogenase
MSQSLIARLVAPRELVWSRESFAAAPDADEVVAETEISAISPGTELAAYAGAPPLRPGTGYPRLVGYCNVARVTAAGTRAGIAVGSRIVTTQSHRDRFRIPAALVLCEVPEPVPGEAAAVAYLLQLGLAALQRAGLAAGHEVAVVGMGVLGVASVMVARALGAPTSVLTKREAGRELALELGAGIADPSRTAADIVIDTSNGWEDFRTSTLLARKGGTVLLLGFPGRGLPPPDFNPFDPAITYARQLAIIHGGETPDVDAPPEAVRFNLARNMRHLMRLIADGSLPAQRLVSRCEPATRLGAVYQSLLDARADTLTVALDWRAGATP